MNSFLLFGDGARATVAETFLLCCVLKAEPGRRADWKVAALSLSVGFLFVSDRSKYSLYQTSWLCDFFVPLILFFLSPILSFCSLPSSYLTTSSLRNHFLSPSTAINYVPSLVENRGRNEDS